MSTVLIHSIGTLITGDLNDPVARADAVFIDNGRFAEIGTARTTADTVINARGNMVMPGLIDSHVHLSLGEFTAAQNSTSWITNYLHGGITRMVSAGELHLPGLPLTDPDPLVFKSLAILSRACYDHFHPSGVKVEAGTLLLVPGFEASDFAEVAGYGRKVVKFIFYPYGDDLGEARRYVDWAHQNNMMAKIHSGGVSRSGVSRLAGADVILGIQPDIVGHMNGGPIPMPVADMEKVLEGLDGYFEIVYSGNHVVTLKLLDMIVKKNLTDRVILGTDTPSGTGVTPRGMLRILAIVASSPGIAPEQAICMATGGPALAHNLDSGFVREGKPADCLIAGKIRGSSGDTPLEALKEGNLLGISMVLIDGRVVVRDRSQQTPPPETGAVIEREAGG